MPFSSTGSKNPDPLRCDSFHEATHAVIGVILGFQLKVVVAQCNDTFPHCKWDFDSIGAIQESVAPSDRTLLDEFTKNHAIMCLAPQFGEAIGCDVGSDEQTEAFHCDYLDAQRMRHNLKFDYFGRATIPNLESAAQKYVDTYKDAIQAVADLLYSGKRLSRDEVAAQIAGLGLPAIL